MRFIQKSSVGLSSWTTLSLAVSIGTLFCISPAQAWTYKALYQFTGGEDGRAPFGGLLLDDQSGSLFGITAGGGDKHACSKGCGVIFELAPDGSETVLYTFTGGADGAYPRPYLVRDKAGNLYGSAAGGGDLNCEPSGGTGCGVIFRLGIDRSYTVLHTFSGSDGVYPNGHLARDVSTGALYGTTASGGNWNCGAQGGCGILFKLAVNGHYKVLHIFGGLGSVDGGQPRSGPTLLPDGNLYGTTTWGASQGAGTLYKITADGQQTVCMFLIQGNSTQRALSPLTARAASMDHL